MTGKPFYIDMTEARSVLAEIGVHLTERQMKRAAETDGQGRRKLPFFIDPIKGTLKIERQSLIDRGPVDVVLALGLIHHLSLMNHVPFALVAEFLRRLGPTLVIEFPSREDSQVRTMLSRVPRLDASYGAEAFERDFARCFTLDEIVPIAGSERTGYLMRAKGAA